MMNSSNRIITNTIILYAKIFIDMVLALWTVPLVMRALGQSDYGLYNLVAGVVAMLTFLNGSMTVVTQRYMSVTMGKNNLKELNQVYNASIRIHIVLGIILVVILEIFSPFLFNGFLNIETGRTGSAMVIYQFMIISTLFTIIAVPFDATLNAYENMLAFSLVSIAEAIFKLLLAFSLYSILYDRLIFYGLGLAVISIIGVIIRFVIVKNKYRDLKMNIKGVIPKPLYNSMLSYAGWNAFGSVAMMGKNQGIAIVLNLFKGTTINAAYGIANQVNGLLSSFTASIQKAISPQLMKHEGASRHNQMIEMALTLVKMATIIFSLMAIPLFLEMNQIMKLWLHENIPEYTIIFCQMVLIIQLVSQLSAGIALSIDAVGRIRNYRIVLSAVSIFNIPIAFLLLKLGCPPFSVFISMIVVEFMCLVVRLYFANRIARFPLMVYMRECLIPLAVTVGGAFFTGMVLVLYLEPSLFRLFLTILITASTMALLSYRLCLTSKEKRAIGSFCSAFQKRVLQR